MSVLDQTVALERIQQDSLAFSLAQAVVVANEAALGAGVDVANHMVTISEDPSASEKLWRINYIPRNYINRRGGDFIVLVNERAEIKKTLRGQ